MQLSKFAAIVAASVSLAAVSIQPGLAAGEAAPEAAAAQSDQSLPAIRVVKASSRRMVDRVMASGTIEAVEEVYVQPQVDGLRIETLKADVGDEVKAGSVLATLSEDTLILQKSQLLANRARTEAVGAQFEAQLAEARANEEEAIRQANRAEKLTKSNAISEAQAEQLRAAATMATARVNSARQAIAANQAEVKVVDAQIADIDLKLARTEIKAPVDGVISVRNARIGAIASGMGNPLFTIIRDGAIELKADVSEADLLKLKPGQVVHIQVAGTSARVEGKVRTVEPVVDASTRLGTVRISIEDPGVARIGMYASAEVVVSERDVLTLPLTAITTEKNGIYVRKVDNGQVKLTKIVTGVQDGDFIEIAEGLAEGDIVVEKAGAFVRDGDRVQPVMSQNTASN